MRAKELTIIFFALMLSAAALASEKQRISHSDDMEISELHEVRIVREEVDVTN